MTLTIKFGSPARKFESKGADEKLSYEKGHKNSKGEDAPWVIRSHKDGSVLASFPTKKEAENHMKTMKRYSKTEGRFTEIKAAIKAAWSAAEAKWFRLDFQESTERLDVYPIASDNEGVGVNWGVLPERNTIVQYATDLRTGNSEIEREMPYKDLDELEEIFVDEFKSMDETLEVGADNGADIHPLTESAPKEVDTVLKKNAPKLIDILNAKFKAAGFDVALKLTDPENASFSDGWYLNTKSTGNWDSRSRMFNLRLAGTEYNGVVYKDGNIYLKKGARPASNRGAVVHPFGVGESRPTEREVDNFLHNALDWASIDDGENRIILKFIADAGKFALVGYDGRTQKTLASGELFSVVDRFRELVEMDQDDAIREFEKE